MLTHIIVRVVDHDLDALSVDETPLTSQLAIFGRHPVHSWRWNHHLRRHRSHRCQRLYRVYIRPEIATSWIDFYARAAWVDTASGKWEIKIVEERIPWVVLLNYVRR